MRNKRYERELASHDASVEDLWAEFRARYASIWHLEKRVTELETSLSQLDNLVVGLQETQRTNQLRIIKLEEATTHKPYYIPTPAQPYKRWETTPADSGWTYNPGPTCNTTVDL